MAHDSRTLEHLNAQGQDIARRSSVPKKSGTRVPVHSGMQSKTRAMAGLGAPPDGTPPDASSPSPLDPTRQGKSFKIPPLAFGHKSHPLGAKYDPALAHAVFDAASRDATDYARDLHTELPSATVEE